MNDNMIKKLIYGMATAFMVTAMVGCSGSDEVLDADTTVTDTDGDNGSAVDGMIASTVEFEEGQGDDNLTRSSLQYNRVTNKMKMSWVQDDAIAVFSQSNKRSQLKFILDQEEGLAETDNSVTGCFKIYDLSLHPIQAEEEYMSYYPYKAQTSKTGEFSYETVPVSFAGQTQTANVKMNCYWQYLYGDAAAKQTQYDTYLESETAAAAHLCGYDYMVSDTTSTKYRNVLFKYNRLASIVRFYMYAPAAASEGVYYDSIMVVNSSKQFTVDATMNVVAASLTTKRQAHTMTLAFNPAIDMTNNTDKAKATFDYWDQDYPDNGYIMAYMMIAPVNLKGDDVENSVLYLCGHTESGNPVVKTPKYYRATLSKINFEAGKHHQWVADAKPEGPITFSEVNVQTWKEETYQNDGKGTANW